MIAKQNISIQIRKFWRNKAIFPAVNIPTSLISSKYSSPTSTIPCLIKRIHKYRIEWIRYQLTYQNEKKIIALIHKNFGNGW